MPLFSTMFELMFFLNNSLFLLDVSGVHLNFSSTPILKRGLNEQPIYCSCAISPQKKISVHKAKQSLVTVNKRSFVDK
jgi:hypothetical protein